MAEFDTSNNAARFVERPVMSPKPRPEVCLSPTTLDPWLQANERKSVSFDDEKWHGCKRAGAWVAATLLSWGVVGVVLWGLYLVLIAWGASS